MGRTVSGGRFDRGTGNSRNGHSGKTVPTEDGKVDLAVPRDREIVEPVAHVLRADRIDAPSVRLTMEPLQRRCTIHVLRPFGRDRRVAPPCWGTPRTGRVTASDSGVGGVGTVALKRRAGCKPLSSPVFRRFAEAWADCDFLRHSARFRHTPRADGALPALARPRVNCRKQP